MISFANSQKMLSWQGFFSLGMVSSLLVINIHYEQADSYMTENAHRLRYSELPSYARNNSENFSPIGTENTIRKNQSSLTSKANALKIQSNMNSVVAIISIIAVAFVIIQCARSLSSNRKSSRMLSVDYTLVDMERPSGTCYRKDDSFVLNPPEENYFEGKRKEIREIRKKKIKKCKNTGKIVIGVIGILASLALQTAFSYLNAARTKALITDSAEMLAAEYKTILNEIVAKSDLVKSTIQPEVPKHEPHERVKTTNDPEVPRHGHHHCHHHVTKHGHHNRVKTTNEPEVPTNEHHERVKTTNEPLVKPTSQPEVPEDESHTVDAGIFAEEEVSLKNSATVPSTTSPVLLAK